MTRLEELKQFADVSENNYMNDLFFEDMKELEKNSDYTIPNVEMLNEVININVLDYEETLELDKTMTAILYKYFKNGYEAHEKLCNDERNNKLNGNALRDYPSKLFMDYIKEFSVCKEDHIIHKVLYDKSAFGFKKERSQPDWVGYRRIIGNMGHFANALWNGDIEDAFGCSDIEHHERLEILIKRVDEEQYETTQDERRYYYNHEKVSEFFAYMNRLAEKNGYTDGVIVKDNYHYSENL